MLTTVTIAAIAIIAFILIATLIMVANWYQKPEQGQALVITGTGTQKYTLEALW